MSIQTMKKKPPDIAGYLKVVIEALDIAGVLRSKRNELDMDILSDGQIAWD